MLPRIVVKDPVIHDTWKKGKFTTYTICVKTDHSSFHLHTSAVQRRFSEFLWLLKVLKANHPKINFPVPPSKNIFGERFQTDFMNSRSKDIENFLNELVGTESVLSDTAFHLFLQTDLTTHEIAQYMDGTFPEDIVEKTWQNAGHLHMSNYFVNTTIDMHDEPQDIAMNNEDRQYTHQLSSSLDESNSQSSFDSSLNNQSTSSESFNNYTMSTVSCDHSVNIDLAQSNN